MITFKKTPDWDNRFDHTEVTISTDTVNRAEVIEAFLEFMTACTFPIDDIREAIECYDPIMDEVTEQSAERDMIDKMNNYNKYSE
jgi:hypothetical protein